MRSRGKGFLAAKFVRDAPHQRVLNLISIWRINFAACPLHNFTDYHFQFFVVVSDGFQNRPIMFLFSFACGLRVSVNGGSPGSPILANRYFRLQTLAV